MGSPTRLRQSEQFGLRWENVDFQTGIITVPRSKHGEKRHVPMNDTAREILRSLPSRMKSAYVFPSATGETPIDPCNFIARVFRKALNKAGVEDFRWHDLRHTFASRLVTAGVDLRTVQELLGHKTIMMTLRYSHLSPAHQLEAVQRLNPKPTGTTTGTEQPTKTRAARATAQVVAFPAENSAPGVIRTPDLLVRSPFGALFAELRRVARSGAEPCATRLISTLARLASLADCGPFWGVGTQLAHKMVTGDQAGAAPPRWPEFRLPPGRR
ncbi:MAG TPA: site-specific integrase [Candidatus Dormibacteraeota bacterium]|nr:site-specific integrase [Candidatus Dormibacteraeota bacterium]